MTASWNWQGSGGFLQGNDEKVVYLLCGQVMGDMMGNLNYDLFEEFKHLDKICGEIYGEQHGVTHYIDDMKMVSESDYRHIPDWKEDLERLIRLRHIRNYLAHTEGAFEENACTSTDIEWSRDFYRRILDQSDPLALLHQYFMEKQRRIKPRSPDSFSQIPQIPIQYNMLKETAEEINVKKDEGMTVLDWIVLLLIIIGGLIVVLYSIILINS